MTDYDDDTLDRRVAALPRKIEPQRDLWPAISASIGAAAAGRRRTRLLQVAAAAALFLAGWVTGHTGSDPSIRSTTPNGDPLAAAVEVQRAGSAYVAALAELRAGAPGPQPDVFSQARDAAIAAVEGAAWELTQMRDDPAAAAIFAIAERDRRAK